MIVATKKKDPFVEWFRASTPYIHAHRGRTFVIAFGGAAVASPDFADLIHDIALLHGLGIRLVLVHGARPQIEERLKLRGAEMHYIKGLRVTDDQALVCVKDAAGAVRVEIEALLSLGLANSPMAGVRIQVASGNFVTARPLGIRDGVDYCHTGEVRRVDAAAIRQRLDAGAVCLVPPLGYSPTGEVFNLSAADVAEAVATALGADKLILIGEDRLPTLARGASTSLTPAETDRLLARRARLSEEMRLLFATATSATRHGVKRAHLLSRQNDAVLLRELFTRDGTGLMVTSEPYEQLRPARVDDVTGILELLTPLEEQGALVRRSRELLETEIDHFIVMERDGMAIGCAALYPYPDDGMAELACLVVHPDYRGSDRGDQLLARVEEITRAQQFKQLFALTTQTSHWFRERGFEAIPLQSLPMAKRQLYNYRRNSRTFIKDV
ncbi:MAG: amino-acid N-acetyltransferase [Pseudomonadota bacterium]